MKSATVHTRFSCNAPINVSSKRGGGGIPWEITSPRELEQFDTGIGPYIPLIEILEEIMCQF